MKTKWLLWSVWVVAMLFVAAQPAKCEKIKEIKNLHYSSFGGSRVYSGEIYELTCDDECTIKIKLDGEPYEKAKTYSFSDEQVEELIDLFNEYEVWRWNGFNEHDSDVMDGSSFYFTLNIQDGKEIEASGYMMYPENYGEVIEEMLRIIDEGKEEVIDEGEAAPVPITVEKIDNLLYAYSDFTDYDNALYSFGGHKVITVHSGDGLPENKEEHSISDEQVEELIDVFNKYEVWRWNGFNKDTIGEGSFSFILFVQDGITIEAEGHGIYPENFWEVIQELNRILDEGKEDNCILEEDDEEEEVSEEEGDNGVLVPIIIGAGALVVVLVVIGVVRKKKKASHKQASPNPLP